MASGPKLKVTTNNDIAYLWWSVPAKIPGCLGFSIHREVQGGGPAAPLKAWVGFERGQRGPKTTDVWPLQTFQWKDVFAPRTGKFRYRVFAVSGTPLQPAPAASPLVTSPWVELREQFGKVRVVFNRGLLSTQALNRGSNAPARNAARLRKAIGTPGHVTRERLARELLPTIQSPMTDAVAQGGKVYAALYELTDEELQANLESVPAGEVVLANADTTKTVAGKETLDYDGTNRDSRARLKADPELDVTDRLLKGASIGHNKFLIYENAAHQVTTVVTGSSNWTPTGLCGQTNNAVRIDDAEVAAHYHAYWTRLRNEQTTLQGADLRTWTREHPKEIALGTGASSGRLKVWFSPNTAKKTKDPDKTPVDLDEVFALVRGATKAVLFLVFNPGTPSIIDVIKDAATARSDAGKRLYVRGAISDPKTAAAGAVRVFSRSPNTPSDIVVTGAAGVPDDFGYWERELLKLGHAAIHDKVLVVDPFSANCAVVTGSHNLGFKASYANDENLVIIRRHRQIAEAYATHVLDVVNHYKWRYKLQALFRQGRLDEAWQDLADDDAWQDKYFDSGFLESRDAFVLS